MSETNEDCSPAPCSALTEEQLEIAARKYCELAGVDPDKSVAHGADPDENGMVPAICLYSPQWKRVAREIAQHDAVRVCIAFAQNA